MRFADWSGFGGDGDGIGVDVEAGELNGDSARIGPSLDAAQSVTIAAADVEDAKWVSEGGGTSVSSQARSGR